MLLNVIESDFLLYVAMLVVFNNQAYILYLFTRKKKEEVFVDKGYLKEHSIGALKIMHKVLGDIIEDHPAGDEKTAEDQAKTNDPNKNVISISRLITRKDK